MDKKKFYQLIENPSLLNKETLVELKALAERFPYFHAAQILYLKNLKETNDPKFDEVLKKTAPLLPDRKQLYYFLHSRQQQVVAPVNDQQAITAESEYKFDETEPTGTGNSLIDQFLAASPGRKRFEKKSDETGTPGKVNELIEKSVSEQEEFVTETLANIYLQQKKYDKALEAFEKLRLKYPEKNSYFASQIEKIIKLKNI
ncbi:MAG TPA: tetratricopeptide repeat protein [Mariniphaga sp.]|nr:tetratricopeptide repeat protein [Mariniphaga sp.]